MAKGFIPAFIAVLGCSTPWFAFFIAVAAVFGHMYSVFLSGGGGKGVATGAGIVAGAHAAGVRHHHRRVSCSLLIDART